MTASNEQVKKAGRPPKNGKSAQTGAARARAYRNRKLMAADSGNELGQRLLHTLTRIIIASSERGELNRDVRNTLEKEAYAIDYIKACIKNHFPTLIHQVKLNKSLDEVSKEAEQADLEDYIDRLDKK